MMNLPQNTLSPRRAGNRIAVLASTYGEISHLVHAFGARKGTGRVPWELYTAHRYSKEIIIVVTGIGCANASAASASLLQFFSPDIIILTGCAGAYHGSGLSIGDIVLADSEIFADEGVATSEGWFPLDYMGIPVFEQNGVRYFNEIPLCSHAAEAALETAKHLGIKLPHGKFLTVSTCSGTPTRAEDLYSRFGGICENMEGAAVALSALRYGSRCLEIRGISNHVEDRNLSTWDIPCAVTHTQEFLKHIIERV